MTVAAVWPAGAEGGRVRVRWVADWGLARLGAARWGVGGHASGMRARARAQARAARTVALVFDLLDVTLKARLDRVGRVREGGADRAGREGGGDARAVLRRADRVGEGRLDLLAHDRHPAKEAARVDAFPPHLRGRAPEEGGGAGLDHVDERREEPAALGLLLDHDQLDRTAHDAREDSGADAAQHLLAVLEVALLVAEQDLLEHAVDVELAHHAEAVVDNVGDDASVEDGRVEREGHAVLRRILPVVGRLEHQHVCEHAVEASQRVSGPIVGLVGWWAGGLVGRRAHRQCHIECRPRSSPANARATSQLSVASAGRRARVAAYHVGESSAAHC